MPNTLSVIRALLVAALIAACWSPALAVDVPALFAAEVPLDEESDNPRNDAYEAALREVLLRVSGSELVQDEDRVSELFPLAASYVTQFRPGEEDSLWVAFDGQAIEKVLRDAGQRQRQRDEDREKRAVHWGRSRGSRFEGWKGGLSLQPEHRSYRFAGAGRPPPGGPDLR